MLKTKSFNPLARILALFLSLALALPPAHPELVEGSKDERKRLPRNTLRVLSPIDAGLEEKLASALGHPAAGLEERMLPADFPYQAVSAEALPKVGKKWDLEDETDYADRLVAPRNAPGIFIVKNETNFQLTPREVQGNYLWRFKNSSVREYLAFKVARALGANVCDVVIPDDRKERKVFADFLGSKSRSLADSIYLVRVAQSYRLSDQEVKQKDPKKAFTRNFVAALAMRKYDFHFSNLAPIPGSDKVFMMFDGDQSLHPTSFDFKGFVSNFIANCFQWAGHFDGRIDPNRLLDFIDLKELAIAIDEFETLNLDGLKNEVMGELKTKALRNRRLHQVEGHFHRLSISQTNFRGFVLSFFEKLYAYPRLPTLPDDPPLAFTLEEIRKALLHDNSTSQLDAGMEESYPLPSREAMVEEILREIRSRHPRGTNKKFRVGVDGITNAGKKTLADELADRLAQEGYHTLQLSEQELGFVSRSERDRWQAHWDPRSKNWAYWFRMGDIHNALDLVAQEQGRVLLRNLYNGRTREANGTRSIEVFPDTISIYNGWGLADPARYKPGTFDLLIHLVVPEDLSETRLIQRDSDDRPGRDEETIREVNQKTYLPVWRNYVERIRPHEKADLVYDTSNFDRPVRLVYAHAGLEEPNISVLLNGLSADQVVQREAAVQQVREWVIRPLEAAMASAPPTLDPDASLRERTDAMLHYMQEELARIQELRARYNWMGDLLENAYPEKLDLLAIPETMAVLQEWVRKNGQYLNQDALEYERDIRPLQKKLKDAAGQTPFKDFGRTNLREAAEHLAADFSKVEKAKGRLREIYGAISLIADLPDAGLEEDLNIKHLLVLVPEKGFQPSVEQAIKTWKRRMNSGRIAPITDNVKITPVNTLGQARGALSFFGDQTPIDAILAIASDSRQLAELETFLQANKRIPAALIASSGIPVETFAQVAQSLRQDPLVGSQQLNLANQRELDAFSDTFIRKLDKFLSLDQPFVPEQHLTVEQAVHQILDVPEVQTVYFGRPVNEEYPIADLEGQDLQFLIGLLRRIAGTGDYVRFFRRGGEATVLPAAGLEETEVEIQALGAGSFDSGSLNAETTRVVQGILSYAPSLEFGQEPSLSRHNLNLIVEQLVGNIFKHVEVADQAAAVMRFSLVQERSVWPQERKRFLRVSYSDKNTHHWEIPVSEAVLTFGATSKLGQSAGLGLPFLHREATRYGGTLIVEVTEPNGTRARYFYQSDGAVKQLAPTKESGTEIVINIPIHDGGSLITLQEIRDIIRSRMATGLEEHQMAFATAREFVESYRSAIEVRKAAVIGENLASRFGGLRVLAGLEESVLVDQGDPADTAIRLAERGMTHVHYFGGLEETRRFTAVAGRLGIEVTPHNLQNPTSRLLLHEILSGIGVAEGFIASGLEELDRDLEEVGRAA